MPRRNGPQERATGLDGLRERLPRSIAARLARAGLTPSSAPARPPESPRVGHDADDRGDDYPTTRPATFTR